MQQKSLERQGRLWQKGKGVLGPAPNGPVWRPPSFGTNLCRGRALTRAEGLQHHVRQCAQTPHHRRSLWPLQVHHQRALAPGQGARVARGAGSVYTHHLRPEVRQDHTAERGRGQAGQLHDPNALQRPGAPHLPQKAERSRQPSAFSNAAHPLLPCGPLPLSGCVRPRSLRSGAFSSAASASRPTPAGWEASYLVPFPVQNCS